MDFNPGAGQRRDLRDHRRSGPGTRPSTCSGPNRGTGSGPTSTPTCSTSRRTGHERGQAGGRRQRQRQRLEAAVRVLSWENKGPTPGSPAGRSTASAGGDPAAQVRPAGERRAASARPSTRGSSEGDVVGPTVFGHAGAAAAIAVGAVRYDDPAKPERLLLARPGHPLLRPGHRRRAGGRDRRTGDRQARPGRRPTAASTTFFAAASGGRLALLRHLGRGAARRRGRGPGAPGQPRRLRGPGAGRAGSRRAARSAPSARPRSAPACSTPTARSRAGAAADGSRSPRRRRRSAASAARRSSSAPTARSPSPARSTAAPPSPAPRRSPSRPRWPTAATRFAVSGIDLAGRAGGAGPAASRSTPRRRARSIAKHPPKLIRTQPPRARAVFRFRSNEAGAELRLQGRPRAAAALRPPARRAASAPAGTRSRSGPATPPATSTARPAVFRFRVERIG